MYVWVLATLSCRLLRLFQYFDNFWFSAALAHVQLRVVRELTRKQQGARRSLTLLANGVGIVAVMARRCE